jgi:hypothetical protein
LPEGSQFLSPTKAAIRSKLTAKRDANQAEWLAFQESKKIGQTWTAPDTEKDAP